MKNSVATVSLKSCYGCGLCEAVCPKNAISMSYGQGGFIVPTVNPQKCINCGLCSMKCPTLCQHAEKFDYQDRIFLFKGIDRQSILNCSSGGFVFLFCLNKINNGFVVYASKRNKDNLLEFRGSIMNGKNEKCDSEGTFEVTKDGIVAYSIVMTVNGKEIGETVGSFGNYNSLEDVIVSIIAPEYKNIN